MADRPADAPHAAAPASSPFTLLRRSCFIVAAFGSLLIPGILQAGVVPQKMNDILRDFHLSEQDFGFLAGGIAAAASLLGVTAAWVAPRIGIYRVCLLGYGLFAVGLGTAALYPEGRLALIMGTLTAWGLAYLHLGNGLVVRIAPHRAGTMTNLLHGVNSFGKAIGPLFALIGTTWNAPFLAIAGLGGVLGLIGLAGQPPATPALGPPGGAPAEVPPEGQAREALRRPLFWCCGALFIPIVAMEQMVVIWLPQYLKHPSVFGPEHGSAAALTAASLILWTELAARLAASWLLTRISPLTLLCLCVPFSAAILLIAHAGLWESAAGTAALLLCGIAYATPWPTFFALASRFFPRHHSLLAVLSGGATSLAVITSLTVGGYVGKNVGFEWTLAISPVCGFAVVLGAILINARGEAQLAQAQKT